MNSLSIKKKYILVLAEVFFPLLIGAFLYYVLYPEAYFVKFLDNMLGYHFFNLEVLREHFLFKLLRNYFMDFLWGCSLNACICLIIGYKKVDCIISATISIVFIVITESLQLLDFFPGTFDKWDLFVEISGGLLILLINNII